MSNYILGIDPGLASFGWAALELSEATTHVLDAGVIRTQKSKAKRGVLASDDNHRRIRELALALSQLGHRDALRGRPPIAFAAESQSWPRNAGASAKVGMAWGIIGTFAQMLGAPMVQASPQAVKKHLTGKKTASKAEVIEALVQLYGEAQMAPVLVLPKTLQEHAADALAAAVTSLDSEVIRMARVMGGRAA